MNIFTSGWKPTRPRWPSLIIGAVLGAAVAVSGTALAGTLSASSTVIHACYARSGGALRYVRAGTRCRSSEKALSWDQTGPRGLRGLVGSQGPPGNLGILNPVQLGTLQWWGGNYDADEYGFLKPDGIVFDGAHMWVANYGTGGNSSRVTEFNAADGKWIQTLRNGGSVPYGFSESAGIAFDGTHIWVVNTTGGSGNLGSLTEINPSDGSLVATYDDSDASYGFDFPIGIAFDGKHLWVTNENGASVTEIGTDGALIQRLTDSSCAFNNPYQIAYDGSGDMWVTNDVGLSHGSITEFSTSTTGTCKLVERQPGGNGWSNPSGIVSDGTHIWVAVTGENSVLEFNISDGSWIGTFNAATYGFTSPLGMAFDGSHVWVVNTDGGIHGTGTVTEMSAANGSWMQTVSGNVFGLAGPAFIAYDGSQMWVTNFGGNSGIYSVTDIVDK